MKKIGIPLISGCILMLTTCTKDIGGPGPCFDQEVLPIFVNNCTMSDCHSSASKKAGYDLTSYEGIMRGIKPKHPLLSEIYKSIKGNNPSMPRSPYPKLSAKDINAIKLWINMGAKNTNNCDLTCDTLAASYASRISTIMTTWCTGCHNSSGKSGGYDLSSYDNVKQVAGSGKLLGSIKHLPGYIAMPESGGAVSQCDIAAIQKWIGNGMP